MPPPEPKLDTWIESKPPVGTNNVLKQDQIRYCLAEDVRIDAAEPLVDDYSQGAIARFNAMVNDYNRRCGSFRYRSGSLEAVQREIARARLRLEQEGRARFAPVDSGASNLREGASRSQPPRFDQTVRDIQQQLFALGYDPGVADGLLGVRTVVAIEAFQSDQGLTIDGVASRELLDRLIRTLARDLRQVDKHIRPEGKQSPAEVCSYKYGTASYNRCRSRQLQSLSSAPLSEPIEQPRVREQTRDAENYQTCISGEYPALCKHSLLTSEEAALVAAAERRANYQTCISGEYPALCKHSLLTSEEAARVGAAEQRARAR